MLQRRTIEYEYYPHINEIIVAFDTWTLQIYIDIPARCNATFFSDKICLVYTMN